MVRTATIELTNFNCPVCSGNRVSLPVDHTDDTPTQCANCEAALGRWGDIRRAEGPLVSDRAKQDLKDALNSVPAWNVKK